MHHLPEVGGRMWKGHLCHPLLGGVGPLLGGVGPLLGGVGPLGLLFLVGAQQLSRRRCSDRLIWWISANIQALRCKMLRNSNISASIFYYTYTLIHNVSICT